MRRKIESEICRFIELGQIMFKDKQLKESVERTQELISTALKGGNKILIFGNGGSAADAQHFAAELVCQFERPRRALAAIALTTDTSILTAQSNDYGFESVFSRQIQALCQPGDVVFGITTSDVYHNRHSQNIFEAFGAARQKGAKRVGLFSVKTKNLLNFVDVAIQVPSEDTALIQQAHRLVIHLLCKLIEEEL